MIHFRVYKNGEKRSEKSFVLIKDALTFIKQWNPIQGAYVWIHVDNPENNGTYYSQKDALMALKAFVEDYVEKV